MQKRGLFASKKGTEDIYTTIIDLVLIAVVIGILFFFFSDVFKNTYFEKSYLARDLALTIESVQGAGTVYHTYQQAGLGGYNLDFTKNKVSVSSTKALQELPGTYPYYTNYYGKNQLLEAQAKSKLYMAGCDGSVIVNTAFMVCPSRCLPVKPAGKLSLVVLPLSATSGNLQDEILNRYAADVADYVIRSQRVFAMAKKYEGDDAAIYDAGLSIKAVNSENEYVKIFFQPGNKQSVSMACHILNSFAQKYPLLTVSTLPEKQRAISTNPVAIEIGIVQSEGTPKLMDAAEVSGIIMKGMGDHFAQ